MRPIFPTLLAAAVLSGIAPIPAAATEAAVIWQPVGPTKLDQQPDFCTLSREFAAGDGRLVVQFRTTFSLATYTTTLASETALREVREGKIRLSLPGTANTANFDAQAGTVPDRKDRFVRFYAHDFNFPASVASDQNFRFSAGRTDIEVRWPGAAEAFKQFTRCHDATLADTGIDMAAVRAAPVIAAPANFPAAWVTNQDYPSAALVARQEGEVRFLVTVGTDGSVAECRIVKSSGSDSLDNGTCSLIRRRAKFEPARDEKGMAVTGYYLSRVAWRVPQ